MEACTLLWGISPPPPSSRQAHNLSKAKYPDCRAPTRPLASPRLPAWLSSTADVHRGVALDGWIPWALQRAREEERRWQWPWQRACVTKVLCLWRAYIYCRCPCGFIHIQVCVCICGCVSMWQFFVRITFMPSIIAQYYYPLINSKWYMLLVFHQLYYGVQMIRNLNDCSNLMSLNLSQKLEK